MYDILCNLKLAWFESVLIQNVKRRQRSSRLLLIGERPNILKRNLGTRSVITTAHKCSILMFSLACNNVNFTNYCDVV